MYIPNTEGVLIDISFNITKSECYADPRYKLLIAQNISTELRTNLTFDLSEEAVLKIAWECCKAVAFKERMEEWEKPMLEHISAKGEAMIDEVMKKVKEEYNLQLKQKKNTIFSRVINILKRKTK